MDFQQFGERIQCHGTMPSNPRPGAAFMQVLWLRGQFGPPDRELPVLVWHFDPEEGVYGAWFDAMSLQRAVAVLRFCGQLEPSKWRLYLTTPITTPDVRRFDGTARSLEGLVGEL
jgi:hypothetical protein